MANVIIEIDGYLNESLGAKPMNVTGTSNKQDVGAFDIVYFQNSNTIYRLGELIDIDYDTNKITVNVNNNVKRPSVTDSDFIFFGKDQELGASGLTGYYAEVKMKNEVTDYAELFAVGAEVFESSK